MTFNVDQIRAQFPILSREINGQPVAYLDNAASAQKPQAVLDALSHQMSHSFANVHRGLHSMANETTEAYEGAGQGRDVPRSSKTLQYRLHQRRE